ncbi:hypothetical protein EBU99_01085 [bacterium]|nr:hypothetical protein [bacterium]
MIYRCVGTRVPTFFSMLCAFSSSLALAKTFVTEDFTLEERSILSIKRPGYLSLAFDPTNQQNHLLISSFQLFGADSLFSVTNWQRGLAKPEELDTTLLNNNITWPNEARTANSELFAEKGILVSGGFLVPGKSTGAITFVPWAHPEDARTLTAARKGWFYHRTEEIDINEDGLQDIMTARAFKPMMGASDGELLWLENPGPQDSNQSTPWKEHVIARGPDVHFRILRSSPDQPLTIFTTEFFNKRLTAHRLTSSGEFNHVTLDDQLGSAFDIQLSDLNADGTIDLLVTNHEGNEKASVIAYEIDHQTLKVKSKHTLLTGIPTRQKGFKASSPGPVISFTPTSKPGYATRKPWILVSGDGSQKAHLLVPNDDSNSNDWNYREYILWNPTSTVGQSAVGDIDGDGRVELFIPAYDANQVAVFTLTPTHVVRNARP